MKRLLVTLSVICAMTAVAVAQDDGFTIDTISDGVFMRMKGKSFPKGCSIEREQLRYLRVRHYDADGQVQQGELVCNRLIAEDLIQIFRQLYKARYPIERMQLIDDYGADDEQSMRHNNTSCFCFRRVAGSQKLSKHAQGLAIDINPLYNPHVKRRNGQLVVQPATARRWANRKKTSPYTVRKDDLCHRLFKEHGFSWGGSWQSSQDYQHFER